MTTVSDNFTRANAPTLGANWSSQTASSFGIVSNAATDQGGFSSAADFWSANTFGANQFASVVITTVNSGNWGGPIVRASNAANTYYSFETNGVSGTGNTYIRKNIAGTVTEILAIATTVANGDTLELDISGTTLTAKKNGSTVGSVTDAAISSGFPGLTCYGGTDTFNTWSGGDLASNSASIAWVV